MQSLGSNLTEIPAICSVLTLHLTPQIEVESLLIFTEVIFFPNITLILLFRVLQNDWYLGGFQTKDRDINSYRTNCWVITVVTLMKSQPLQQMLELPLLLLLRLPSYSHC